MEDLLRLPASDLYAVKPKAGADSIGLEFVPWDRLRDLAWGDVLVQPRIDFRYEVSFYYVDDAFQYALHAPDPERRWVLEPYEPTEATSPSPGFHRLEHPGPRHPARRRCRTRDGELLLVELRT